MFHWRIEEGGQWGLAPPPKMLVGPQRGKDDRREYVRGGVLHGG